MKIKKTYLLLILILILTLIPIIVYAQTSSVVTLGSIDLSLFPEVNISMDVREPNGEFLPGLTAEDVFIIEDGQEFQVSEVIETRIGAQVVVAINLGTSLHVFDDTGIRRLDYITQNLTSWIGATDEATVDSFSLLSTDGVLVNPTFDGKAWSKYFQEYNPVITVLPSWDVLSMALDMVSDPLPKEGMGRVVIFITPILPVVNNNVIQSYVDRAKQNDIRLYIGLLDSSKLFESEEALQLEDLALQTGGEYFAFSGYEVLPDLNAMIESSRGIYQVFFNSKIVSAGDHEFVIGVHAPNGDIWSGMEAFSLDLRPPNPFFLSPPSEILRTIVEDDELEPQYLFPKKETVQILIEFPDTIDREIVKSTLYINGEVTDENNGPPFTEFTFDLRAYETSQQLSFRVEALDEFGLIGSSIDTPISIVVEYPEQTLLKVVSKNINLFTIGLAVFVGGMLLFILILAGQVKPDSFGDRLRRRIRKQAPPPSGEDDLKPQIKKNVIGNIFQKVNLPFLKNLSWVSSKKTIKETAFLMFLSNEDGTESGRKHSIFTDEILVGSKVDQSQLNLDNAAVNDLHARIWQDENGEFQVADMNSTAGTWINYSKINSDPNKISHGDLLHIATVGFRFLLTNPPKLNPPKITLMKDKP